MSTAESRRRRGRARPREPHDGPRAGPSARVRRAVRACRGAVARAVDGDRPLLAGILTVLVLAMVMLSGPLQNYLGAHERVETLEAQATALERANSRLRQQVADLRDPEHIELLAREEHGMVFPGQLAYVIVPPESERPRITDPVDPDEVERPWYERAWRRLREVVG